MPFPRSITLLASLATAALAAPAAFSEQTKADIKYTLPSTGSTDLPGPSSGLTLKYITVGHGIQNYTCASDKANASAVGALAVLYDITPLYPGTPGTGLSQSDFDKLPSTVLATQSIPLNLQNPDAANPKGSSRALSEEDYQAVATDPFPAANADLSVNGLTAKFLARHYFDDKGAPTFDLVPSASFLSGARNAAVKAPAAADKGTLATGAVDWLQLGDNGRGLSKSVSLAYRVVTAGGAAQACSKSGASASGQVLSVPYAAQYWFYG